MPVNLPKSYSGSGLTIERAGMFVTLSSRLGVSLLWDGGKNKTKTPHNHYSKILLDAGFCSWDCVSVVRVCVLSRYACLCTTGSLPSRTGRRFVWKFWRKYRKWLHHASGHHWVHSGAVWKLLEGQPILPWCGRSGSQRPVRCEFHVFTCTHVEMQQWKNENEKQQ